jgi:hypothetical protein
MKCSSKGIATIRAETIGRIERHSAIGAKANGVAHGWQLGLRFSDVDRRLTHSRNGLILAGRLWWGEKGVIDMAGR